ncbi:DUF2972 domain-containing protein [Campylobacter coli]
MHNPQSATERIKNSLSYKLGSAILEYKKQYRRGFLILIYKLYKIKKQHFKDQKLYKQIIKIFPQLAYPKLETCSDYNESIRYKYHLSYMLGEVLIHAHKTWYKGGYFKLYKNIQTVKMQYNLLKELSLNNIDISPENKELLMDNFDAIKDILQTHKDYKSILENIFHNFKFFLANLTLIKEWLLSDDFYSRYKDEKHPYPSLLDPKKLNTDSEEINYKNISAKLAWEMNLPIPPNYDFIWLLHSATGNMALILFLKLLKIEYYLNPWIPPEESYKNMFDFYSENREKSAVMFFSRFDQGYEKIMYLVQKEVDVFIVVRDPISLIRHLLNHINAHIVNKSITQDMKKINMTYSFRFPKLFNLCSQKEYPEISSCEKLFTEGLWIKKHFDEFYFTNQARLDIFSKIAKNIECIEFNDIGCSKAFATFTLLAKKYGFNAPSDPKPFQGRVNFSNGDLAVLPVVCYIHPHDLNKRYSNQKTNECYNDDTSFKFSRGVNCIITTHQKQANKNGFVDITKEIFKDRMLKFDNIILLVKNDEYEILKNNPELFLAGRIYLNDYMDALEKYELNNKKKLITEDDLLFYLKNNLRIRKLFKEKIDSDLIYVKKMHPEYLQKWKYYQEFEKICKED